MLKSLARSAELDASRRALRLAFRDAPHVGNDLVHFAVVEQFAKDLGLTFAILHDRDGSIRRIYQTTGVPESFVIDRDGVIVKKVIGAADWGAPVNENLIRRLLNAR